MHWYREDEKMDRRFVDSPAGSEAEEAGIAPEISHGSRADVKAVRVSPSSPSTSSSKKSRRSVQKRVVSVPIAEADLSRPKGAGEGAPPSDSWAWRKYGQKPIKGSPYPRGYYRCSSSKGCPARKQVERSRVDPTMLVITYSCEHNHPWPLPRNHHHHHHQQQSTSPTDPTPKLPTEEEQAPLHPSPSDPSDQEEKFSDLVADETSLMMSGEFGWFSDVASPSSTSPQAASETLLYAPIYGGGDYATMLCTDECEKLGEEEEEDSLFAGLGELPEFSVVFRRGLAAAASTG